MSERPAAPDRSAAIASGIVLVVVVALLAGLVGLVASGRRPESAGVTATPLPEPGSFLVADAVPAPPLALHDASGDTVSLAALRGRPVLVFFGYTHCPDVCPVTIGTVGAVIAQVGSGVRALFVTVDPERDTPAWLAEFGRFMPPGFTALTGSAAEIRSTADAWGVRYARVDATTADGYTMSHTADVFLVDGAGVLRARFPFGTSPEAMTPLVAQLAAEPAPAAPSPTVAPTSASSPTPRSADTLLPEVVSSSVWAGAGSPVIVQLHDVAGPIADPSIPVTVELLDLDGNPAGPVVPALAIRPPGVDRVSYVADLAIPYAGHWGLRVTAVIGGRARSGETELHALLGGGSVAIGAPAPTVRTPAAADVGGDLRRLSTDEQPEPRLYERSTADLLAAHRPFVLVVDSVRFRVSPACGKAVTLARYLLERWPDVGFIHLEPYTWSLVSETPTLSGSITDPPIDPVAAAWIGTGRATALAVPFVFVVDGDGIVRAKYQGLLGSDDLDVTIAAVTGAGR